MIVLFFNIVLLYKKMTGAFRESKEEAGVMGDDYNIGSLGAWESLTQKGKPQHVEFFGLRVLSELK